MSSYQFVNSLAQCYGQQGRSTGTDQGHQSTSAGGDYYNPNAAAAAAAANYPPACYSPPQVAPQYPQHPYATPATGHGLQPTMGDYTQLQPQRLGQQPHLHHASPGAQSPGMGLNPAASCKYADSTSAGAGGVSSPQDLSTSSGGPPGNRATPPLSNQGGQNPSVTITKSVGLTSPLSVSTSPQGKQAASSTASQNLSSPASSTSSTSSNEKSGNNNNSKGGSSSNPPQIYPWMKRVHLGQSKYCFFIILLHLVESPFYTRVSSDVESS